ncbi:MAG: hypothetical protein QXR26_07785, partial [Candidatus Caldarchaeum sp.]
HRRRTFLLPSREVYKPLFGVSVILTPPPFSGGLSLVGGRRPSTPAPAPLSLHAPGSRHQPPASPVARLGRNSSYPSPFVEVGEGGLLSREKPLP